MKNLYASEKFSNAIKTLAINPDSLQERLANAYSYNLSHIIIGDLPDEVRVKFEEICSRLKSDPQNLTDQEAKDIASSIWDIAHTVESFGDN